MGSSRPFIEIDHISKSFGGVHALRDVSFDIRPGELHALVGENGAGKSTLIKVLGGNYLPEHGTVKVEGHELKLGDVKASEAVGISVIHQEPTAFPHLSSEDSIFIGAEPTMFGGLLLNRPVMRARTKELLARVGATFDPSLPLEKLSVAQRQLAAVARALAHKSRLLIMDEPTASLSQRETDSLFLIVKQLLDEGVSILYVSHRMEEILALADRATVFRDGTYVGTLEREQINRAELIKMMVGREITEYERYEASEKVGDPILQVRGLTQAGTFRDVNFDVHSGEVMGLGGLVGAGRTEVARVLFGLEEADSGTVTMSGKPLELGDIQKSMEAGIAMVPEDRQTQGAVLQMSIADNMVMAVMRGWSKSSLRDFNREKKLIAEMMQRMSVKAKSSRDAVESLSGGNQQKIVLGKWLGTTPKLLILDEPTRGVDVGAKAEIHRLIRELANDGVAVLLISSDLPELLAISDRIVVMRHGSIAGELTQKQATQEAVIDLALQDESVEGKKQ